MAKWIKRWFNSKKAVNRVCVCLLSGEKNSFDRILIFLKEEEL